MDDKITLHPEFGVNPSLERNICPVCGIEFDTSNLLLLGHNKGREAPKYSVTGMSLCPDHEKLWKEGYVALVEVDSEKSRIVDNMLKPQDAYGTGRLAHMRKEAIKRNDLPFPTDLPFIYIDQVLFQQVLKNAGQPEQDPT